MSTVAEHLLSTAQVEQRRRMRAGVFRMQEIESNPLIPEECAMFEMFDREAWPEERCIAYIRENLKRQGILPADA